MQPKKKSGALKWTFIVVFTTFGLLFILQQLGIKSVYTKETSAPTDFNSPQYRDRVPEKAYDEGNAANIDQTLEDIARQYAGEVYSNPKDRQQAAENIKSLSEDEKKFYKNVKKDHSLNDQLRDAENWLNILRASRNTYSQVQSVFGTSGETAEEGDLKKVLSDPSASESAYGKIRDLFGIPEDESRAFAAQGHQTLSDWASWVQKKRE